MADEFSPDELIEWWKDPRGAPFKQELQEMFANRVSGLRSAGRLGDKVLSAMRAAELDTIEEVLQLPDVIIQEQMKSDEDKEKEEAK